MSIKGKVIGEIVKDEMMKTSRKPPRAARSQRELERRIFHLKTLYDVSREIGALRDSGKITNHLLMMVMGTFGAVSGVILLIDSKRGKVEAFTQEGLDRASMGLLAEASEWEYFQELKAVSGIQILGGRGKGLKEKKEAKMFRLLSSFKVHVWIPFKVDEDVRGGIGLGKKLSGDRYTRDDQELLSTLSNQAGVAIENARLYQDLHYSHQELLVAQGELEDYSRTLEQKVEHRTTELARATSEAQEARGVAEAYLGRLESELQSARDIQMSMVPAVFPAPAPGRPVEICATLEPARQVGGDLYDFFYTDEGQLCFLIGDVSDKGAPAALFMARAMTLVRLMVTLLRAPDGGPPTPHEVMARVNEELCRDNGMRMFVTVLLGVLDPTSGALQCCNAGHLVPYVLGRNGVEPLEVARGKPLGIRPGFGYDSTGWTLSAGDCLFLFTDGITEAMDGEGKLFGEERLQDALRSVVTEDPAKVVAAVIEKVNGFTGAAPRADDCAALAVRFSR